MRVGAACNNEPTFRVYIASHDLFLSTMCKGAVRRHPGAMDDGVTVQHLMHRYGAIERVVHLHCANAERFRVGRPRRLQ